MRQIKTHKYNLKQISFNKNKSSKLIFGNFGLKSLNIGLITQKHLENLRRKLSKQFKKLNNLNKTKFFIHAQL